MTTVTRRSGGFRPATWSRWRHYGGLWRWFGDERLWGAAGVMVIGSEPKGAAGAATMVRKGLMKGWTWVVAHDGLGFRRCHRRCESSKSQEAKTHLLWAPSDRGFAPSDTRE
ncbi:hypothetical protein HanIR_Chr01g0004701 [Helianthus annuus]|nr:hypothetical protein HanIR_Chr01g0004701 [Helianthus annuus]KAJ0625636.1 hypothetical protein HanHA89_Chr01g0003831 [Helianthus annuus]KAJ0782010.1 hypothetical protein HanLR1_Chr01g0003231 [Helianthus annuus]